MDNKYQESLDNIINWTRPNERLSHKEDYANLQELIDKETSMKVIEKMYKYPDVNRTPYVRGFECPNCYQRLHTRYRRPYCSECGQKLNWNINERKEYRTILESEYNFVKEVEIDE